VISPFDDPRRVLLRVLGMLVRSAAAVIAFGPAWLALELFYRCCMCGTRCASALRAEDHGRVGPVTPLCSSCFDNDGKLMHAMTFARARWR
jgi:hypothetical protein